MVPALEPPPAALLALEFEVALLELVQLMFAQEQTRAVLLGTCTYRKSSLSKFTQTKLNIQPRR
jgi:hypothetical protein